jgi:hypothetical protein
MAALVKAQSEIKRGRGRPRVDSCRIECNVPRTVMQILIAREQQSGIYRTRLACRILCEWASRETGKSISASPFGAIQ